MAGFKISTKDVAPEDMDGDKVDPGWYFATLTGVSYRDKDGAAILDFKITGPMFVGKIAQKTMNDPGLAATQEKTESLARQARSVAMRLGLLTVKDAGKSEVDLDFVKAIGWKGVIEMEPNSFTNDEGRLVHTVRLGYPGMFPLNHEKIPVHVREALGMPLLPGQVPTPKAETPKEKKGKEKAATASTATTPAVPAKPMIDLSDI